MAQPKHEPMDYKKLAALGWQAIECEICGASAMGYPQRTWVGLTDEDIALIDWESLVTKKDCVQAIEAKLKELNHD